MGHCVDDCWSSFGEGFHPSIAHARACERDARERSRKDGSRPSLDLHTATGEGTWAKHGVEFAVMSRAYAYTQWHLLRSGRVWIIIRELEIKVLPPFPPAPLREKPHRVSPLHAQRRARLPDHPHTASLTALLLPSNNAYGASAKAASVCVYVCVYVYVCMCAATSYYNA